MFFDFLNDSPEFKLKQKQLQLAREHAQEWQKLFTLEISNRQALEKKHMDEIGRFFLMANFREQAALLTRQLQEINGLRYEQEPVRESTRIRQAQEKEGLLRDK